MSEFAPPNPATRALPRPAPQLNFPEEILAPLLAARETWQRLGYVICARNMVQIDAALDDMLAYQQALRDFEQVFGKEMENVS